jgi:ubiquitin carboxyl-terminal hydrolase MINDY-1/2
MICNTFLQASASQLTYHGLQLLHESMDVDVPCVFFRNNHFSTIVKRSDGKLYTLVTDQGFAQESQVVWETLDTVDGDSEFVDSDFSLKRQAAVQKESLDQTDRE